MCFKNLEKKSYTGVALAIIIVGVAIAVYGLVAWLYNSSTQCACVYFPASKVMGGITILALGYILLELELLRKK